MTLMRLRIPAVAMVFFATSLSMAAPSQIRDTSHRLYNRVMEEFQHRDYEAALAGFRLFVELHGQSTLVSNAQYWIGECQYRLGRYQDALATFYHVVAYYPLSPKLAASTLKIGQIYTKSGHHDKARTMFERVMDHYPDSIEAGVARKALGVIANTSELPSLTATSPADEAQP